MALNAAAITSALNVSLKAPSQMLDRALSHAQSGGVEFVYPLPILNRIVIVPLCQNSSPVGL